jgi:DNA-binding NarL/FixJ family response regulator
MTTCYICGLTRRELEITHLACQGLQNKEIGNKLHIAKRTVAWHLASVYAKLGFVNAGRNSSRYRLLMWAIDNGLFKRGQVEKEIFGKQIFDGPATLPARLH